MKTGAETGWDYSSRWMVTDDGSVGCLGDTRPRSIIPVDLNSFLARNAHILATFSSAYLDDPAAAADFASFRDEITAGMDALLWCEDDGVWYDYDFANMRQRAFFTPSNLVPLWTESFVSETRGREQAAAAVAYLARQDLGLCPGGVPTTFTTTGEQWDFPNCWPPLEHMLVQGLEKTGLEEAREMAFRIAQRRVVGSYANFREKGHMFEKVG